jgi:hypothetical protein
MAVMLKCLDCGYGMQAEDEESQTCPMCEGTMTKPKYKAKSGPTSSDVEKAKPKTKSKYTDDEENEEKPAAKPKATAKPEEEPLPLDEGEDEEVADFPRSAKAAERVGIDPGFSERHLMKQVESELTPGEVLHWAGRPSLTIAKKKAMMARIGGVVVVLVGIGVTVGLLMSSVPTYVVIVPALIILGGIVTFILGPKSIIRQAEHGWYALTDRRAIVCQAFLWGKGGLTTTYTQGEVASMWIKKSYWAKDGGSLVFRTEVKVETVHHTSTVRGRRGHRGHHGHRGRRPGINNSRTSTTTTVTHYGFLDIEEVSQVEMLVREVLLKGERISDDEEEDDQ